MLTYIIAEMPVKYSSKLSGNETSYHSYRLPYFKIIITNYPSHLISKEATLLVERNFDKADVVDDQQIDQEVIRINSYFKQ